MTAFQRHIEALRGDTLEASDLEDSHSHELLALIEKKRKGGKDVIAAQVNQEDEAVGAQIVDLMEYLKKSIGGDAAEPTEKPKRPRSAKRKAATAQPKKPRRTRPT